MPQSSQNAGSSSARIFEDLGEFFAGSPAIGRLLAMDFGTKTIGLAMSDPSQTIASPLETIKRKKFTTDAIRLDELVKEHEISGFVLGLPRNLDGTEGPRAQSTRAFARNLIAKLSIPILLWDERLTTVAAERALLEADASRARRAKVIDQVAATLILQGVLTARNSQRPAPDG